MTLSGEEQEKRKTNVKSIDKSFFILIGVNGLTVRRCDGATVRRCDGATVRRCDGATVRWFDFTIPPLKGARGMFSQKFFLISCSGVRQLKYAISLIWLIIIYAKIIFCYDYPAPDTFNVRLDISFKRQFNIIIGGKGIVHSDISPMPEFNI